MTASSPATPVGALAAIAATREIDPLVGSLLSRIPDPTGALAFVNGGDGLVGWGEYASLRVHGDDAAPTIGRWFTEVLAGLQIDDPSGSSGPVAFVSLGFDPADESVAVVPRVLLSRRNGRSFSTVIGDPEHRPVTPLHSPGTIRYSDATMSVAGYISAVAAASLRIRAGKLAKVVLSHDLTATTEYLVDERFVLDALAARYPSCWTYAVAGLVGASPEMLMHRKGSAIISRVLAGTGWAEHDTDEVSADLLSSSKNQQEHRYAAETVAAQLKPLCSTLEVPSAPSPLVLANLTHLCTDITGVLAEPAPTALDLAGLLHPTPAVGGTPTAVAMQTIRDLESSPRGRYAGPTGWLDARGDGEFALALRCAEIRGKTVRMRAGGGIVAGSDPQTEAREAQVKMLPIRDALES